jgi:hypothetical protein
MSSHIPNNFICPITHEVLKDPVVDKEGHSYEREAIIEWLNHHGISPMTRRPMTTSDLVPNRALQEIIENTDFSKYKSVEKLSEIQIPVDIATENVSIITRNTFNEVLIKLQTPKGVERTPVDICCVVDISYSMSDEAVIQNKGGDKESDGFNILDIVKHAIVTILSTLSDKDSLSIVTFSNNAEVKLETTIMNENGKNKAKNVISLLRPTNSTNLWAGLEKGLDLVRTNPSNRLSAIFLFTDGCPNVEPPRGHLPTLRKYKEKYKGLPCLINTFGFGYELDSQLLHEIAYEGNGAYVFIPDSGFVGTTFVNATANLFTTMAQNASITIKTKSNCKVSSIPGGFPHKTENWGCSIDLGSLQYDQSKDVIVKIDNMPEPGLPNVKVKLTYDHMPSRKHIVIKHHSTTETPSSTPDNEIITQLKRLAFVDIVSAAMVAKNMNTAKSDKEASLLIKTLLDDVKKSISIDPRIEALLKDIEGQVQESFITEYYKKWGRHFLPSLITAHRLQICNNFKDPGVQVYGGDLFESLRDTFEEIFRSLPAPTPSIEKHTYTAPINMASYFNESGGCIAGDCDVEMADGTHKKVKDIAKNDLVRTPEGIGRVRCVLKSICAGGKAKLVEFENGLLLTEWHPIMFHGKWCYPVEIADAIERSCESVFSFLLDSGHVMFINGIACVGLGHDFKGDIREHDFFGTQKVVENMRQMEGWDSGIVIAKGVWRNKQGLICGLGY